MFQELSKATLMSANSQTALDIAAIKEFLDMNIQRSFQYDSVALYATFCAINVMKASTSECQPP